MGAGWTRFRGPNGSGTVEAGNLPEGFSPASSVVWKTAVPFGRSSPVLAGGRVILTGSEGKRLVTEAYDAGTGRRVWRRELTATHSHKTYAANDPASPTPAADEEAVYSFFADFGLVSYTLDGRERWRLPLGPFENFYGMSGSPVVAGGMVFLLCDQVRNSFLIAVDAGTGKPRWKRERAGATEGWSTPVVYRDQLIAVGSKGVDSYQLATGEPRWSYALGSTGSMGSPAIHGGHVIVTAMGVDQPWMPSFAPLRDKLDRNRDGRLSREESKEEKDWFEHFAWVDSSGDGLIEEKEWETARAMGVGDYGAVALPLNGKGRLEAGAARWRLKRSLPYVPAPVLYGGVFYMVKDGGIITSVDPETGKVYKQGRSAEAPGQYLASPVAADGKVYLFSEAGKVTVLKAGAQWEVLSVNDMGEEIFATPAIGEGRIYLRTRGNLYAFGRR
jgi:outer membrane protein assembly factor BamB